MSSATSTDRSSFRPWHFFVLGGLVAATTAVVLARDTAPASLLLVSAAIISAALAGIALYRTLAPLVTPEVEAVEALGQRARAGLEREKNLVLRSIKELEFDRAMGKIAESDFDEMVDRLRGRAIVLLRQLDAGDGSYRELIERELAARLASKGIRRAPGVLEPAARSERDALPRPPGPVAVASNRATCEVCETVNDPDARFCKQCGQPLAAGEAAPGPRA